MVAGLKNGADPLAMHRDHVEKVNRRLEELMQGVGASASTELKRRVNVARRYVAFREDGKDFLMLGYALLRGAAMEISRRLETGDGIFFLQEDEALDALRIGYAPLHLIATRRLTYRRRRGCALPQIVDAEAIDTLGEPPALQAEGTHPAFAACRRVWRPARRIVARRRRRAISGAGMCWSAARPIQHGPPSSSMRRR